MRLTKDEKEFLLQYRYRIGLDATDWTLQTYVNDSQLVEMSPHVAQRILRDPLFVRCPFSFRWINTRIQTDER